MMVSFYYILMFFFFPPALEILAPIGKKKKRNLFDLFQDLRDIYAFTEIKNVNL